MAGHNNTLSVQVDLQASTPSSSSFGIIMLACLSLEAGFTDNIRTYTSISDVDDDEDDLGATAAAILSAIFQQSPHVTTVKVGKLLDLVQEVTTFGIATPGTEGEDWTVTLNGEEVSHTLGGGESASDVATALAALIDALPFASAAAAGSNVTVTAAAGLELGLAVPSKALTGTLGAGPTISTAAVQVSDGLSALEAEDAEWYGLLLDSNGFYNLLDAAEWVSTRRKLGVFETNDAAVIGGTEGNIAATLDQENAVVVYHDDSSEHPAAAWAGNRLYFSPDTWATVWHKASLDGITEVAATSTQATALTDANANWFDDFNGVGIMDPGVTASGDFIDLVILKHWLEIRLAEDLSSLLVRATAQGRKIPYTQQGIDAVASVVKGRLLRGVSVGHIEADTWEVTAPRITDVEPAARAARLLSLSFSAVPTGGIKGLTILGNVALPV